MTRKRICVLLGQMEEDKQARFMQAFLEEAFATDYDVCVFSMCQKYQEIALRDLGDSNIYQLVNYALFDAVVILLDTILTPGLSDSLQQDIRNSFQGPVLVVDQKSDYFPSVMMDHYAPVVKLMHHLICDHGYCDIAFLGGKEGHIHSVQRLQAYLDTMKEYGLPVPEHYVMHGNYWYDSGEEAARKIIEEFDHVPQALVCANDIMAIGASTVFSDHGYRIGEDIAIVGYDSFEDGKNSPVSITSAPVPVEQSGSYCMRYIDAVLHGREVESCEPDVSVYIGESCGCRMSEKKMKTNARKVWRTNESSAGYHSDYNHIMEDLMQKKEASDFFNTLLQYTYQIRPFESFYLCLNQNWGNPAETIGPDAIRHGYSDNMCQIISCYGDAQRSDSIHFDETFETETLLPALYEEREKPVCFTFVPLFFDDRCFGYSAISYGNNPHGYDKVFVHWIRNVMLSLETLYRQMAVDRLYRKIEESQTYDNLTGLMNYIAFQKKVYDTAIGYMKTGHYLEMIAIDLNHLRLINEKYGREAGNAVLTKLSQMICACLQSDEMCCRLYNDEFLISGVTHSDDMQRGREIVSLLLEKIDRNNENTDRDLRIEISYGMASGQFYEKEGFEQIINDAVVAKNRSKTALYKTKQTEVVLSPEQIAMDRRVAEILDQNLLYYHFQPIVLSHSGEIFAYEALMRSKTEPPVSPSDIIQSAERMGRLTDVEKATFHNVLDFIDENTEAFAGKKVFINSMPGVRLDEADQAYLKKRLAAHKGNLVIEFTEESEMENDDLKKLKAEYSNNDIEIAIDDYGAGYSNVNNLLRYMPHFVKIDRMLLSDIDQNPQKQHFVKDIVSFAKENNIMTLAEGVETSGELREAIRLNVDLIQGYYTARPNPVPLVRIDEEISGEMMRYSQASQTTYEQKQYIVKDAENISLVEQALHKFARILIKKQEQSDAQITLCGATGFRSEIGMVIEEGFSGTIVLKDVFLTGGKNAPSIMLSENTHVTLHLVGDNYLQGGGICVPESSSLTMTGDGNLTITLEKAQYFGIGNRLDAGNGLLLFRQDGTLTIHADGMRGVGIGSGRGGCIRLERGKYEINVNGLHAVGIGCASGGMDLSVCNCDISVSMNVSEGVLIGSFRGNADFKVQSISGTFSGSGKCLVGIGSLDGAYNSIRLHELNILFHIRAREGYAVGSRRGETFVEIDRSLVRIHAEGPMVVAMGNASRSARIHVLESEVHSDIKNDMNYDYGAEDADIFLSGSRPYFFHNGQDSLKEHS